MVPINGQTTRRTGRENRSQPCGQVDSVSQTISIEPARVLCTRTQSLRVNFAWAVAGQAIYSACQWAILAALAKLASPAAVGKFALALAITGPIFMFANLQLRAVCSTDARREFGLGDYVGLQLAMIGLGLLVTIAILAVAHYDRESVSVILIVALAKSVELISEIIYGFLQQQERLDRVATALLIRGPLSLGAVIGGIWLTGSVIAAVAGMALAWMFSLCFVEIRLISSAHDGSGYSAGARALRPRWRPDARKLFWLVLPLGWVNLVISLNANIPRYFIEHTCGVADLGIFSAMAYLALVGSTGMLALANSVNSRLSKYYLTGNSSSFISVLLRIVALAVVVGSAGVILAIVAGPKLLAILYRPEYAVRGDVLIWLMLAAAAGFVMQMIICGMTSARRIREQLPLYAVSGILLSALCMVLVPRQGLTGAGVAMLVTNIVLVLGGTGILVRALRNMPRMENEPVV
jgi:O-antigen/teichoic acid export membrane protein